MKPTRQLQSLLLAAAVGLAGLTSSVSAQTITYQGILSDQGGPADGLYEMKFQFRQPGPPPILFDPPIVLPVLVSGGRFTAPLETAGVPVQDPAPLELVICVRRVGQPNFVQLDPPQPVTPAPRAIAADSVAATGLPGNVVFNDDPPVFTVPLSGPQLLLPQPDSTVIFGPTGECTIGIDPRFPGLSETDPNGFRLLGRNLEGCRLLFGPTDDCTIEVLPPGGGPGGLLLRDPSCIRVLPPDPTSQPGIFYFGPTDLCSLGIDPPGGLTGLVERDPVGFRLAGRDQIGCRLLFGPDDLCTVEIDPQGPAGLLLRDPRGIRILPPRGLPDPPRILFGPTDDCSIGLEPNLPGLVERDPTGFRLLGQDGLGCRLIFGPTMDCTVEVDPKGPAGLLLRDPRGIRILSPDVAGGTGAPTLRFGPTDDCSLGIDPQLPGLVERDPTGFRLLGQDNQGCRLIFGPTMDCTIEVAPPETGPKGLLLRDPSGIRIMNPADPFRPQVLFGPTDDCRIRVGEPSNRPGLLAMLFEDPNGFTFENDVTVNGLLVAEQIQPSSRRYKENIHQITNPLETIEQLQGVTFDWKEDRGGGSSIGFIAEEVGKVLPEVVAFEDDGVNARGVNYGHLVAVTVEGIKAQQSQIRQLENENNELKDSLAAMKSQMEALAAKVDALNPR